jgi:hypothetical protein
MPMLKRWRVAEREAAAATRSDGWVYGVDRQPGRPALKRGGDMQGGMNNELWLSHSDEVRPQMDLQERVWAELRWEPEADTADVNVTVEDFVATLSGTVPSYRARMAVAQAAARIPGIRAVRDETVVVPQCGCSRRQRDRRRGGERARVDIRVRTSS